MVHLQEQGQLLASPAMANIDQASKFEELMFSEFADHPAAGGAGQGPPASAPEKQRKYSMNLSQRVSSQTMSTHYAVSPAVDQSDMTLLHYLIQSAIADSKGFKVLSDQEVQTKKRDLERAKERLKEVAMRVEREKKMEQAAGSLAKYHLSPTDPTKEPATPVNKRLSLQALSELQTSQARLSGLQRELENTQGVVHSLELELRNHMVAVLGLSHVGSRGLVSQKYMNAIEGRKLKEPPAVQKKTVTHAVTEDEDDEPLNRGFAKKPTLTRGKSVKNTVSETFEDEKLESLILTVSSVMPMQESPGPLPSTRRKLDHLEEITRTLVREYVTMDSEKREQEAELDGLREAVSMLEMMQSSNGELNILGDAGTTKSKQMKSLQESFDANRTALEQLEVENVELQRQLKDAEFARESDVKELETEVGSARELADEWKERSEATREELESVLKSLEDLTRQTVEYESERTGLEKTISDLQAQLLNASNERVDKRLSQITLPKSPVVGAGGGGGAVFAVGAAAGTAVGAAASAVAGGLLKPGSGSSSGTRAVASSTTNSNSTGPADPPMSVVILQQEFRKILRDLNRQHSSALQKEQREKKKLQSLVRSHKGLSSLSVMGEAPGDGSALLNVVV